MAATQTGFFNVVFPNFRIVDFPSPPIGQGLAWVENIQPMRLAGLPQNTAMIFPAMTEITRIDNGTGTGNNASYIINNNFSQPYYPGNMMIVKNVTNEKGREPDCHRSGTKGLYDAHCHAGTGREQDDHGENVEGRPP